MTDAELMEKFKWEEHHRVDLLISDKLTAKERLHVRDGMEAVKWTARAAGYDDLYLAFFADGYDPLNVAVWRDSDGVKYGEPTNLPTFTVCIEGDSPAAAVYDVLEKMKHYIL